MTTEWFKHDVHASHDPKIVLLRKRYGWEGYGLYFKLLEMLCKHPEYVIPLDDNHVSYIQIELDIEMVKLREFLQYCYDIELFTSDGLTMWSPGLAERMKPLEHRREAGRIAAEKRWGKKFVVPTKEEVETYAKSIDFDIDGESFIAYYGARGWIMNNNKKMKCWKSAVVTWKKRRQIEEKPRKVRDVTDELEAQLKGL